MKRQQWIDFKKNETARLKDRGLDSNILKLIDRPIENRQSSSECRQPMVRHPWKTSTLPTGHAYLPIEFFKTESARLFQGQEIVRSFLSSGTTSRQRSRAHYSQIGLDLYRLGALATFFAVMEAEMGLDFWTAKGISLIPKVEIWPDSSLAQMVEWISQFTEIAYVEPEALSLTVDKVDGHRPVWVFGTAFHFVNLIDHGYARPLPTGSRILETGGTKGQSREISAADFYQLLASSFSISTKQILSEYGMCELSSQAYGFCGSRVSHDRALKFPAWVTIETTQGLGEFYSSGQGSLLISDPLRVDYPVPVRAQDMVEIHSDRTFQLLGRIPGSVLKGCSLLAEEAPRPPQLASHQAFFPTSANSVETVRILDFHVVARLAEAVPRFLDSPHLEAALASEVGCNHGATSIINDLRHSMPSTIRGWVHAIETSQALKGDPNWLYILPNNHPIAGVYPLVLGAMAGLAMTVRVPANYQRPQSSVLQWISFLQEKSGAKIATVGADFRLGTDSVSINHQSLLCFGSDDTVELMTQLWGKNIVGLGSSLGIGLLDSPGFDGVQKLVKDALGLGQKGCLSTRCVITAHLSHDELNLLRNQIVVASRQFWDAEFTLAQRLAIDCEEIRLASIGADLARRSLVDDVLVPIFSWEPSQKLGYYLSETPFVLPIINLQNGWQDLPHLLDGSFAATVTFQPDIILKIKDILANIQLLHYQHLGAANQPSWDGTLHGQPLFLFSYLR